VNAVRLRRRVLEGSFQHLRHCGAGRNECVLYWCAATDQPDVVARVVHPAHRGWPTGYTVDSAWITQFFLELRRTRRTVRVQVHTHPGPAGHSQTDDQFSLVPAPGFLSLVIPHYATGPVGLQDTFVARMQADGTWMPVRPEEVLRGD